MSAEYLFGLNPENFRNRVKSMSNEDYQKFLNSVNSESKMSSYLSRFGNTTNANLKTRKNKLAGLQRKLMEKTRLQRLAAAATGIASEEAKEAKPALVADSRGYTLGRPEGAPSERQLQNAERRAHNAERPPRPSSPTVPVSRPKGVTTLANLARKEGKKVFVNISYVPIGGMRKCTQGTQAETIIEKKQAPVVIKTNDKSGPVCFAELYSESGAITYVLLPLAIPYAKGGKITSVPLSQAKPVLDSEKEPKKQTIQHTFQKNNAGIFSISYEANLYMDSEGTPFFYYLNLPELTEGGNNGIVMYDGPFLPDGFLFSDKK